MLSKEQRTHLRRVCTRGEAVLVSGVDANGALVLVLEEPEVGVVGGLDPEKGHVSIYVLRETYTCTQSGWRIKTYGHASDASTGTDEARADINGVGIAWLHVHGREGWERTWSGLVVPGGLGTRAAAWVVAGEEE